MSGEHVRRLQDRIEGAHRRRFGTAPVVTAYAPGRIEVLGNHTDYNEGFVLSAAIDAGIVFALAPRGDTVARIAAADLDAVAEFRVSDPAPDRRTPWANYPKGVLHFLLDGAAPPRGFDATFGGDIPMGSGLSSSAALEIAAGLALADHGGRSPSPLDLARIGQQAEHHFAGAKCGLLDQITSLFGEEHGLVFTDFRSLRVERVELPQDAVFLMCNTGVKHNLVESEYNERRARCEEAARFFAGRLPGPVRALRDVSMEDWRRHAPAMDPVAARRAAHVIGEDERVLRGVKLLRSGELASFGRLMFESHESSRRNFENSCPELDFLVEQAAAIGGVHGARLSGGGFGGSAVVLVERPAADEVACVLKKAYGRQYAHAAEIRVVQPSRGARLLRGDGRA